MNQKGGPDPFVGVEAEDFEEAVDRRFDRVHKVIWRMVWFLIVAMFASSLVWNMFKLLFMKS